jgi:fumarate reductase subunit C
MSRRPFVRELSKTGWWLAQPRYVRYMLREISALFIGLYAIVLVIGLLQLSRGAAAYENYLAFVQGPVGLAIAVVAMIFAVYHTYTWFQVTPKAMPLVLVGKRVPGVLIVAAHWLGFFAVSVALSLLVGA